MLQTHYRKPLNWRAADVEQSRDELEKWALRISETQQSLAISKAHTLGSYPTPSDEVIEALSDDLNTPDAIAHLRRLYKTAGQGDKAAGRQLFFDAHYLGFFNEQNLRFHLRGVSSGGAVSMDTLFENIDTVERMKVALINGTHFIYEELEQELKAKGLAAKNKRGRLELYALEKGSSIPSSLIEDKISQREKARAAKDFAEADRIRDELLAMGVALKDGPEGTTWEIAR